MIDAPTTLSDSAPSPESAAPESSATQQALALRAAGRLTEALAAARAALAAAETPATLVNAGGLCVENGLFAEAETLLRRALAADDVLTQAWWWLGLSLLEQGSPRAAAEAFRRALVDPALAESARAGLGRALLAAERPGAAVEAINPATLNGHPLLALELAQALEALGRMKEAEAALLRAAEALPAAPQPWAAAARVSAVQGRGAEAAARFTQARVLAGRLTGSAAALSWLAVAEESGRWQGDAAAESDLRAALTADPDNRAAKLALGLRLLGRGQSAEGWDLYRQRPTAARFAAQVATQPAPARLDGLRVVVAQDQGVGDEIFFWRFLPELARRGAKIVLAPSAKTAPLARRLELCEQVAVDGVGVSGAVDHVTLTGDLPWWLGWEGTAPSLRLAPTATALATAEAALAAAGAAPWTGVLWRGGRPASQSLLKRAPRAALLETARRRPGGIVLFQRNVEAEEVAAAVATLGRPAADLSRLTDDLEAALAALSLLDAYIGVSTADCHLLALLGRGARVLVPSPGDFRWGAAGATSPWFPDFTVYREDPQAGWGEAFSQLRRDLA